MPRRCSLVLFTAMMIGTLASIPTAVHAQTTAAETSPPSRTAWGDLRIRVSRRELRHGGDSRRCACRGAGWQSRARRIAVERPHRRVGG